VKIKKEPREEEPLPSENDDRLDWDVTVTDNPDGTISFVVAPILIYEQVGRERGLKRAPRRHRRDD